MNKTYKLFIKGIQKLYEDDPGHPWLEVRPFGGNSSSSSGLAYGPNSDLLQFYIVDRSNSDKGWKPVVFDCEKEKTVYEGEFSRDDPRVDRQNLTMEGVGPFEGEKLVLNGFSKQTSDYWELIDAQFDWPWSNILIQKANHYNELSYFVERRVKCFKKIHSRDDTVKQFGFSPTGKTFIIYDTRLRIFRRE